MKSILVPVVTTEMCAQYEKKEKKTGSLSIDLLFAKSISMNSGFLLCKRSLFSEC
jgi:hypothetical protein